MLGPRQILAGAREEGGAIIGFCAYVEEPKIRALIDIYLGNDCIKTIPAALATAESSKLGIGDGKHGFYAALSSLDLKKTSTGDLRIIERRYSHEIGIVRHNTQARHSHLRERVEVLSNQFEVLARHSSRPVALEGFRERAMRENATSERTSFSIRTGFFHWPKTPRASIILHSNRSLPTVVDLLFSLSSFARAYELEVAVATSRSDVGYHIPSYVENVSSYVSRFSSNEENSVPMDAINSAAFGARAQELVIVPATQEGFTFFSNGLNSTLKSDLEVFFDLAAVNEVPSKIVGVRLLKRLFITLGGLEPPLATYSTYELLLARALATGCSVIRIYSSNACSPIPG